MRKEQHNDKKTEKVPWSSIQGKSGTGSDQRGAHTDRAGIAVPAFRGKYRR
jgi:hypothetical protein